MRPVISRLRSFGAHWLPPLIWSAAILLASDAQFSASNTGHWLRELTTRLLGHELSPSLSQTLNHLLRKAGHLTAYGILSLLWFRALRGERERPWMLRWAAGAVLLAVLIASADEWQQSFVPSRTGVMSDVVLDAGGAFLAQALLRIAQVLITLRA